MQHIYVMRGHHNVHKPASSSTRQSFVIKEKMHLKVCWKT